MIPGLQDNRGQLGLRVQLALREPRESVEAPVNLAQVEQWVPPASRVKRVQEAPSA